jgi:membrane-associated phospholipid phosphatase
MGLVYAYGMQRRSDMLLTIYLLGLFLVYAQFPFWPSEPPRTVFAGQDLPRVHTIFRDFNLWLVGGYGIHTSVFPSAHVSGVFAAALAMTYLLPGRRVLIGVYWTYACFVAIATVYGRYHYAVDAAAGIAVAALAFVLARWLERRFMR